MQQLYGLVYEEEIIMVVNGSMVFDCHGSCV